jgi:hypothetical protein
VIGLVVTRSMGWAKPAIVTSSPMLVNDPMDARAGRGCSIHCWKP